MSKKRKETEREKERDYARVCRCKIINKHQTNKYENTKIEH